MTLSVVPYGVEHERFAEKHFNLVVSPILRREGLQEHNDTLAKVRDVILKKVMNVPGSPFVGVFRST